MVDDETEEMAESVVETAKDADLSPELRKKLDQEILGNPAAMEELANALKTAEQAERDEQ